MTYLPVPNAKPPSRFGGVFSSNGRSWCSGCPMDPSFCGGNDHKSFPWSGTSRSSLLRVLPETAPSQTQCRMTNGYKWSEDCLTKRTWKRARHPFIWGLCDGTLSLESSWLRGWHHLFGILIWSSEVEPMPPWPATLGEAGAALQGPSGLVRNPRAIAMATRPPRLVPLVWSFLNVLSLRL